MELGPEVGHQLMSNGLESLQCTAYMLQSSEGIFKIVFAKCVLSCEGWRQTDLATGSRNKKTVDLHSNGSWEAKQSMVAVDGGILGKTLFED